MAKHPFLSDEWLAEVRRLHEATSTRVTTPVGLNLVVKETPFGGDRNLHVSADPEGTSWGLGLLDNADVTLTLDYVTARSVFLGGSPTAGLEAFMSGKIVIQGDLGKLIVMQQETLGDEGSMVGIGRAVLDITD
ncbi:MAG: SCP-2 sterol transfer family protein [Acidimicrobiia bacterium]